LVATPAGMNNVLTLNNGSGYPITTVLPNGFWNFYSVSNATQTMMVWNSPNGWGTAWEASTGGTIASVQDNGFNGNLVGNASFATNAATASFATVSGSASNLLGTVTNTAAAFLPYALSTFTNMLIDPANGNYQQVMLTNATTLIITNSENWTNYGCSIRLELWAGANAVTFATTNLATNLFSLSGLGISNGTWNVFLFDKTVKTNTWKIYQLQ